MVDGLVVSRGSRCDLANCYVDCCQKELLEIIFVESFGRHTNYEMAQNAKVMPVLFHPLWQTTWNRLKRTFGIGHIDCWRVGWRTWRSPSQLILIMRHRGIGDIHIIVVSLSRIEQSFYQFVPFVYATKVYFSIFLRNRTRKASFPIPIQASLSEAKQIVWNQRDES
jgi:hypothetical protein